VIAGFRNASAYARWWEARALWGGVVNNSRSFARQVVTTIAAPEAHAAPQCEIDETQRTLVLLQVAYVNALRNRLRALPDWPELGGVIPAPEADSLKTRANLPLAIQQRIASIVAQCFDRGWIDAIRWVNLDRTLSAVLDCQGGCERIKNTPMPRFYDMFIQLFVAFFCLLLPLGMVANLGLFTPFGSTLVGFIFLALDKIGRDLEAPFQNLPNDIPLTAICRTIEIDLKEMIGEKEIAAPLSPVDGVLW
jgi:ion channel-forming bestrophin family protein